MTSLMPTPTLLAISTLEDVRPAAPGIGNPIVYVGSKTGRDGIHGATMASAEFDEASAEKRPALATSNIRSCDSESMIS